MNKIKENILRDSLDGSNLSEEQKGLIMFSERIDSLINSTLKEVCKLIDEDIKIQKKHLRNAGKYFNENKPFEWRIDGFKALLNKLNDANSGGKNER